MRVLICGGRGWTNRPLIEQTITALWATHDNLVVIEGEARGADTLARESAEALGVEVDPYPADWRKFGRAAGPIRNRQMLTEGKPDLVIAFHSNIDASRGTKNMIEQARRVGIPVEVIAG